MHTLRTLLHDLPGARLLNPEHPGFDQPLRDITINPAAVTPGALFIARTSWYDDTHERADEALSRGAAALLLSRPERAGELLRREHAPAVALTDVEDPLLAQLSARFFDHPTRAMRVFGVTGTNGKTSCTVILEHLLTAMGERVARMNTIDYRFEAQRWSATNTTPDGVVLHRFARQALDAGATALVLEISSHGLAIGRTAELSFDAVAFTNLSLDHLDFHPTFDDYRAAKMRLFSDALLDSLRHGKAPHAAACVDGPHGLAMLHAARRAGATTTAVSTRSGDDPEPHPRLEATRTAQDLQGMALTLDGRPARTHLLGLHNLANVALSAAMVLGPSPSDDAWRALLSALPTLPDIPGRLEAIPGPADHPAHAFVDYAHSPDAIAHAARTLRELAPDRPTLVLIGCGGDRDPTKRGPMATEAADHADAVILTADNPRGEDPERILDAMWSALSDAQRSRTTRLPERPHAIEQAIRWSHHNQGLVLLAGKGHEAYQEIAGQRHHLDDAEEARRARAALHLGRACADTPLIYGWRPQRAALAMRARILQPDPAHTLAPLTLEPTPRLGDLLITASPAEAPALLVPDLDAALLQLARHLLHELQHRDPPTHVLRTLDPEEADLSAHTAAALADALTRLTPSARRLRLHIPDALSACLEPVTLPSGFTFF